MDASQVSVSTYLVTLGVHDLIVLKQLPPDVEEV